MFELFMYVYSCNALSARVFDVDMALNSYFMIMINCPPMSVNIFNSVSTYFYICYACFFQVLMLMHVGYISSVIYVY